MVQIDDVIVSLDVFREKFVCNLDACKGECCIEGDAGAPVELEEVEKLEEVLPVIWDELSPEARAVIDKQGVVYTDSEGDLVTSIVNGKDCVFTCYDDKGYCYCAIEKAYREGRCNFYKPVYGEHCIDYSIVCLRHFFCSNIVEYCFNEFARNVVGLSVERIFPFCIKYK